MADSAAWDASGGMTWRSLRQSMFAGGGFRPARDILLAHTAVSWWLVPVDTEGSSECSWAQ